MKPHASVLVCLAVAVAGLVGDVGRAKAQFASFSLPENANDFLNRCGQTEGPEALTSALNKARNDAEVVSVASEISYCLGYTDGVVQVAVIEKTICQGPRKIPLFQDVAIVRRYLMAHPEAWDMPTAIPALRALAEAFPCAK
jgi:Rap1a immunity proteins